MFRSHCLDWQMGKRLSLDSMDCSSSPIAVRSGLRFNLGGCNVSTERRMRTWAAWLVTLTCGISVAAAAWALLATNPDALDSLLSAAVRSPTTTAGQGSKSA